MNSQNITIKPEQIDEKPKLAITGTGKSGVVVVVNYPNKIPAVELELLTKIMASVNVDIHDVFLVNVFDFQDVQLDFGAINLLFGQKCHDVLFPEFPFYSLSIVGENKFLLIDSLSDLNDRKDLKIKLWQQLKGLLG